jgi:hypothetical protein
MPLALHPNPASAPARRKTDHLVMNGQLEVGRIYKRDTPDKSDSQWLWAINGVPRAAPGVMRVAGIAPSFEQAKAELKDNWEKWLAWANLQELGVQELGGQDIGVQDIDVQDIDDTVPPAPASTPAAAEDIGGSVPLQPASAPAAAEGVGDTAPLQPEPTPTTSEEIGGTVPLYPEPSPVTSDLEQCEPDIAGEARLSEPLPEPASIGLSAGAGRRGSRRRRKSK